MEGKKVYVDFTKSSGTVEVSPLKVLDEPIVVASRSELEYEVERRFQEVKSNLRLAALTHHRLKKNEYFARKKLVDIVLPGPGFTIIADDLYTGWFYVNDRGGLYSLFAPNRISAKVPRYPNPLGTMPYFVMNSEEATEWNRTSQAPLSFEQFRELSKTRYLRDRQLFAQKMALGLEDFMKQARDYSDEFWNGLPKKDDPEALLVAHIREYLEKLAIFSRLGNSYYVNALAQVRRFMQLSGVTVFPVEDGACVVAYRDGNELKFKTLPLPREHIRNFQRYLLFGEQPMTKQEFTEKYQKQVNPDWRFT